MHRRASVAIAAVAVLGLGGAVAQQAAATPATSHAGSSLASASLSKAESAQDGRALFEGLAFAQGSVAKELADSGKFIGVLPSWIPPASAGGGNEAPAEQGRGSRFAAGRTGVHPLPALRHKLMG